MIHRRVMQPHCYKYQLDILCIRFFPLRFDILPHRNFYKPLIQTFGLFEHCIFPYHMDYTMLYHWHRCQRDKKLRNMDNLRHQQCCKYHWHMFCKRIAHFVLDIVHWHMFCKRTAHFDLGIVHWHMFCKRIDHFDLGTCPVDKSVCRDIFYC